MLSAAPAKVGKTLVCLDASWEECHGRALLPLTRGHRPSAGFRRAHGVGAGEEGSGDEEGPAGVLERALVGKLL